MTSTLDTQALLEGKLTEMERKHETFRQEVRDRIIQAHKDGDICLDGTNGGLRDLGLEEYDPTFRGTVTLEIEVRVAGTDNEGTARRWARDAMQLTSSDEDVEILSTQSEVDAFRQAEEDE